MNIDWHRKANADSVSGTASALLRSHLGPRLESALETMVTGDALGAGGTGANERERLVRLGEALATAEPAVPEGEQADIKEQVLAGARSGLAKVYEGESPESFTLGEHIGLEAARRAPCA